jgi:hypothetical protein
MDRNYQEETPAATEQVATGANETSEVASNHSTDWGNPSTRFFELYSGFERAYGTYEARKAGDTGKVNGTALTVRGALTTALIDGHLTGEGLGIGVVPLREDNTCLFGVIDVDIQGKVKLREELSELEKRIRAFQMPLVICRSKSGGAHLYLFTSEPIPAILMVEKLNEWAAALGYGGCEIFPKHTSRVKADDISNWINLPYYRATATPRYGIIGGRGVQLDEFLDHAESMRISADELENFEHQQPTESEKASTSDKDENAGSSKSFDGRNNYLTSRGGLLRSADAEEDEIREALLALNAAAAHPVFEGKGPLPEKEVLRIVKSLLRYDAGDGPNTLDPDSALNYMNKWYAVTWAGNNVVILREYYDQALQRSSVGFIEEKSLRLKYKNKWVLIPQKRGKPKRLNAVDFWLGHPQRREYEGVVFSLGGDQPRHYNLWRGWAVQPDSSKSCTLFLDHVRQVICGGDESVYRWVVGWMADAVQYPDELPGTCLVLRGEEGAGKGSFVHYVGGLYGAAYRQLTNSDQLVGRFNAHLAGTALCFADEAFFAGDKKHVGALKGLITEPTLMLEPKFKDAFAIPNRIRVIMASNEAWVVPAGPNARRFCVLDVSTEKLGDTSYFDALKAEMRNGGLEALMQHLLQYDLTGINLRDAPKTAALLEQKHFTMKPVQRFWYERLKDGFPITHRDIEVQGDWAKDWAWVRTTSLYQDFLRQAKDEGQLHRPTAEQFGQQLRQLCPSVKRQPHKMRAVDDWGGDSFDKPKCYGLPPLAEARAEFEKHFGQRVAWDE